MSVKKERKKHSYFLFILLHFNDSQVTTKYTINSILINSFQSLFMYKYSKKWLLQFWFALDQGLIYISNIASNWYLRMNRILSDY